MVKPFDRWYINNYFLDAKSQRRQNLVIVDKNVNLPEIIYQPLYEPIEVSEITDRSPLGAKIHYIKVAVYKLDRGESHNQLFNFYFYQGDALR